MKLMTVTFTIPTGYIGADITEDMFYSFDDGTSEELIQQEIDSDFSNWVEDIIEDMRMSAEWIIEEEEYADEEDAEV